MISLAGHQQIIYEEYFTSEEAEYIKELSQNRNNVPTISVLFEEKLVVRCVLSKLLHQLRSKHLDSKYGADRFNLVDLFKKGETINQDGGTFVVVPSSDDFGIQAIHGHQPKLMKEYAEIYRRDGLKMNGAFQLGAGRLRTGLYNNWWRTRHGLTPVMGTCSAWHLVA